MSQPAEHVERRGAPRQASDEEDPWVQMNVRVRRSMLERLDKRRKGLGQGRDEWMRHIIEWALFQPPGTAVRSALTRRTRR